MQHMIFVGSLCACSSWSVSFEFLPHRTLSFNCLAIEERESRYWLWGGGEELLMQTQVILSSYSCLPQHLALIPEPEFHGSLCRHSHSPSLWAEWFVITQYIFHFVNVVRDYGCSLVSLNVEFVSVFILFVVLYYFWEKGAWKLFKTKSPPLFNLLQSVLSSCCGSSNLS
jgi:hypothetical protein